jgi:hypothetical protein
MSIKSPNHRRLDSAVGLESTIGKSAGEYALLVLFSGGRRRRGANERTCVREESIKESSPESHELSLREGRKRHHVRSSGE